MRVSRPVWAEINLADIAHNFREVRRLVGSKKVMGIVKANAYGHGAVEVARTLDQEGADYFGVAILNEAVQLREAGITKPILILGWTPPEDYQRALDYGITLTIYSLEEAQELSRIGIKNNKKAKVHLKIDTGMGRIGLRPNEESAAVVQKILALAGLEVEGIFTHFAKADEAVKTFTQRQLELFRTFVDRVEQENSYTFPLKHAANSAATIDHPESYLDMVRPGIILYGLKPSDEVQLARIELRQAMSLRARVSHVKTVPAGTPISYGGIYTTKAETQIASMPLGYADGYTRLLSGKAKVLCQGQKLPVVGRICMDQTMFEAAGLDVKPGDIVTLLGKDGDNFLSVDELAQELGTINYEIVCMISARVPRVYQR